MPDFSRAGRAAANLRFVALWSNLESGAMAAERCSVRLQVGRATQRYRGDTEGEGKVAKNPRDHENGDFLVDTGANITIISKEFARDLGLECTGEPKKGALADGKPKWGYWEREVHIRLGGLWWKVPCAIPVEPFDDSAQSEILGMRGLFGRHVFCVSSREMNLFHRAY